MWTKIPNESLCLGIEHDSFVCFKTLVEIASSIYIIDQEIGG